jgi:hypothetical protein
MKTKPEFRYANRICALCVSVLIGLYPASAPAKPADFDTTSAEFRSALDYGFAKTVSFALSANSWSPVTDANGYILTQKLRTRLGARVRANVYVRSEPDGRKLVHVEYPDFQVGRYSFVLFLAYSQGRFWLQEDLDASFSRSPQDSVYEGLDIRLPEDCQRVVSSAFRLTPDYIRRLRSTTKQAFEEAYAGSSGAKHIFVRPFSPRFDQYASAYWLEGKKILRIQLPWNGKGPTGWSETLDVKAVMSRADIAPIPRAELRIQHEIASHVLDGILLDIPAPGQ